MSTTNLRDEIRRQDVPPAALQAMERLGLEPPARTREKLERRTAELGLEANVKQLEEEGYTVVRDAVPPEFCDRLRSRILEIAVEDRQSGVTTMEGDKGPTGQTVFRLLERGRVFEESVFNPVLETLMTWLLGPGFTVHTFTGMVRGKGAPALQIHTDNVYYPEPFPEYPQAAVAVWCLEDFTAEGGCTRLVPGSHRLRRHPRPGADDQAIPIEAPKGSLLLWGSNVWHGNLERQIEGERVSFHSAFCRMHLRPFEAYPDLPQDVIERNPEQFRVRIGQGLPWGFDLRGPQAPDILRATVLNQLW